MNYLLEERDEPRLFKLQRDLQAVKLLIADELGCVPISPTGAELLFETFSQGCECGLTIVISNLPFEDWTSVLMTGTARLAPPSVSILTVNGGGHHLMMPRRNKTEPPPNSSIPTPARLRQAGRERRRRNAKGLIGALCISSCHVINGLLVLRRARLESDWR